MSATIIMVANTGRLIEMSERNIGDLRDRGGSARRADAGLLAGDGDLHAAAERADVAHDDAITGLQSIRDLHEAESVVGGAELHGRHVDRPPVDAVDVRLAVVGRL